MQLQTCLDGGESEQWHVYAQAIATMFADLALADPPTLPIVNCM